ncbi:FIG01201599: hypothetical protein [hydrothermal vent metagenome]|uniref:COG3332 n=1 Tax=hydrothermal vent metagenome TaxID=652676 RepID=A0A3B0XD02_9ZZZZ
MCTLSWLLNDDGYEVFFNRDEQHTRAQAIAPSLHTNINVIMPIDPQGLGSWIGSNLQGNTLCLLNNYQKQQAMNSQRNYISRGQLIPELLQLSDLSNIEYSLNALDLNNFLAFFLCVFPEDLTSTHNTPAIYQWDGNKLTQEHVKQPVISSSVEAADVIKMRTAVFYDIIKASDSCQSHLKYHSSHVPEKGYQSVCMHRKDAQTQSLTHISVNHEIRFRYLDGAPCENHDWVDITYPKKKSLNAKKMEASGCV